MAITWIIPTDPAPSGNGAAIAYNGTVWVMAGDNFLTSPDGITWTSVTTPLTTLASDVVWCDTLGLFVACGFGPSFGAPLIITSPDGVTWTGQTTPWDAAPGTINGLGWSTTLGQIVACGTANSGVGACFMTSTDGITWTAHTSTADNGAGYYRAAWSASLNLWVAVGAGGDGGSIMTSPDGVTWTTRLSGGQGADVCWSSDLGLFVVAGDAGGSLAAITTSPDGVTWTDQTTPSPWTSTSGVTWSSFYTLFVVVQGGTNGVLTSPDGITWTATAVSFKGNRLYAAGDLVVVAGQNVAGTSRVLRGGPAGSGAIHIRLSI